MNEADIAIAAINDEYEGKDSRNRIIDAFSEVDYAVCFLFATAPVTLAPESVWPTSR